MVDLPVSLNQEYILTADERARQFNITVSRAQYQVVCRIHGDLNVDALQAALNAVIARHEALRATFHYRNGYSAMDRAMHLVFVARTGLFIPGFFVQRIHDHAQLHVQERHCDTTRADASDQAIWDELAKEAATALSLDVGPGLRAVVVRGGPWSALILVLSHLTVDGWSLAVLIRELESFYTGFRDGKPVALPPPALQYRDFGHWQRRQLVDGGFSADEAYWCRQWAAVELEGVKYDRIPFATHAKAMPQPGQLHVRMTRLSLTEEESACIRGLLQRIRITPYLLFRTMLTAVWCRYTGVTQTALWANFANRGMPGAEGLIGWCSNTHVIPIDVDTRTPFTHMCRVVSDAIRSAQLHEALPLPAVWRKLGRNLYTSTTRVNCDVSLARPYDGTSAIEPILAPIGLPVVDLDVRIVNNRGRFGLVAMFNANRYDASGVEGLLASVRRLAGEISRDPERPMSRHLAFDDPALGIA